MSTHSSDLFLFSGSAHPALTERIAVCLGLPLGQVDIRRFPDGELSVQFMQNIRGGDVYIVQPTCNPPNENIMELLIMLDAARRASASRITAVIPYYGYARQDRKDRPRVPITARLVADIITAAGASRILTVDLHAQQIMGFFNIPVDHLYAAPVLMPHLKQLLGDRGVVVAPDSGGVKLAHMYSDTLQSGFALVAKRRTDAHSVEASHLVGEVEGRPCLLSDDLTSTAGTIVEAAKLLHERGASRIIAAISHCLLNEQGHKRISDSPIEELVTTDTVPVRHDACPKIRVFSIDRLLAEAIKRIHEGGSLSSLFNIELGESHSASGRADPRAHKKPKKNKNIKARL